MRIPIVIHKDPNTDYGVTVPDLPGCYSAGRTLDEAIEMAREGIECHIEGMIEDGESIPSAKPLEAHQRNRHYTGGIWAILEIDLARLEGAARRINITVPERVLRRVDRAAEQAGESRSGFFTRAGLQAASGARRRGATGPSSSATTASSGRDRPRSTKRR